MPNINTLHSNAHSMQRHRRIKATLLTITAEVAGALLVGLIIGSPFLMATLLDYLQ